MPALTDAQWFFASAKDSLSDAEILQANRGSKKNVVLLLHNAIEMGLKALLMIKGLWGKQLKIHEIGSLAQVLCQCGVRIPPDLLQELSNSEGVPCAGSTVCETHVEAEYNPVVLWDAISVDAWLDLARRTVELARAEGAFT